MRNMEFLPPKDMKDTTKSEKEADIASQKSGNETSYLVLSAISDVHYTVLKDKKYSYYFLRIFFDGFSS